MYICVEFRGGVEEVKRCAMGYLEVLYITFEEQIDSIKPS